MTDYPYVPIAPGVPLVARIAASIAPNPIFAAADVSGLPLGGTPQWGIYDSSGNQVVQADSVISFEFEQDYRISDNPVEGTPGSGASGFETYNKVTEPFQTRITFAKGGTIADRQVFLANVQSVANDLNVYSVITPEQTYPSCNITHWGYHRTADQGVTLMLVDVWLEEIIVLAGAAFTNTTDPSGSDSQNQGTPQSQNVNTTFTTVSGQSTTGTISNVSGGSPFGNLPTFSGPATNATYGPVT